MILAFVVLRVPDRIREQQRFCATAAHLSSRRTACAATARLDAIELLGVLAGAVSWRDGIQKCRRAARRSHPIRCSRARQAATERAADPAPRPKGGSEIADSSAGRRDHRRLADWRRTIWRSSSRSAACRDPRRILDGDTMRRGGAPSRSRVDRRRRKFQRRGRNQKVENLQHGAVTRPLRVFPLSPGRSTTHLDDSAGQGGRRIGASLHSARRQASIQRRQVFGAPDHFERDAGRRPHLHPGPHEWPGAPATISGPRYDSEAAMPTCGRGRQRTTARTETKWRCPFRTAAQNEPRCRRPNVVPYKGGFAPDPGHSNYRAFHRSSRTRQVGSHHRRLVRSAGLLKSNCRSPTTALGDINLDPSHGDGS